MLNKYRNRVRKKERKKKRNSNKIFQNNMKTAAGIKISFSNWKLIMLPNGTVYSFRF